MSFGVNPFYKANVQNQQNIEQLNAPAKQQASILDDPKTEFKLEEFCQKYCPGVSVQEMKESIQRGEVLEKKIASGDIYTVQQMAGQLSNDGKGLEAVKDLMWLLTAKTAMTDELYTSGSMRLSDKSGKAEAFIRECGGKAIYKRGSTHMQEHRVKGEKQDGLDLRNIGMPANKRTLLFQKLPDGSLFLKMEERGFPPFWKTGFQTFRNFAEYIGHCGTFLHTRFKKGGIGIKQARKEHVPQKTKEAYTKLIQELHIYNADHEKEIKDGKTFGLTKMDEIVNKKQASVDDALRMNDEDKSALSDQALIDQFRNEHLRSLGQAEVKGYIGEVKGNEVLLPPLGKSPA